MKLSKNIGKNKIVQNTILISKLLKNRLEIANKNTNQIILKINVG